MRNFLPTVGLAALLLAGCGNENGTSSTFNVSGLPQPSPIDAGVSLQASNFYQATSTMLNAVATDGGGPGLIGRLDSDSRHPLAVLSNIQASYGALLRGGSTTLAGPGGGSATATVNGTTATLSLNGFTSPQGSITGTVLFAGSPTPTGFTGNATFQQVQVVPVGGQPYRLDGPTNMLVNATSPNSFVTVFGSNATVTDLGNGSTLRYLGLSTTTNISSQVENQANGTQVQSGGLLFNQYQGLTGAVNVSTPQVLRVVNSIFEGGQWLFQGSGQTRVTGLGSNSVLIEGAPVGNVFAPVQTVDLATILGVPRL